MSAELALKITKEDDPLAWQEARRQGLGGTDMARVMGLSPWGGPLDVYMEKKGLAPKQAPNRFMERGTWLEPVVADYYQAKTGMKLQRGHAGLPVGVLRHKEYPWWLMNIDRVLLGERAIVEIKTLNLSRYGRIKAKGVPADVQVQGQHYLGGTNYDRVLFILFSAELWEYMEVSVEPDPEIIGSIKESGEQFWFDHVLPGVPPEAQPTPQLDLPEVPANEIVTVTAPEWAEAANLLRDAEEIIKGGQELKDGAVDTLKNIMGSVNIQAAEGAGLRVHWKYSAPGFTWDIKRLMADHPEIDVEKYKKPKKASRPFKPYFLKGEEAYE